MARKGIRFSEYAPHCPACKAEPPAYEVNDGFKCHACGASGDLFDWTMQAYGMTFQQALQKLHRDAFHPPN